MDNDVICGVRNPEVVHPDKDFFADAAKLAVEFRTMWGGGHGIDGDGIPVVFVQGVKDLAVFSAMFFEDVLWCVV
jgi:hypothetical protein